MNQIKKFHDLLFDSVNIKHGSEEEKKIETALNYIVSCHYNHRDRNGDFFIYHPISVASILAKEINCKDIDVICSALLHDVFEKCDVDLELFKKIFGEKIYSFVDALTKYDWLGLDDQTRTINYVKRLKDSAVECRIIKLADRLDRHRKLFYRNSDERISYIIKTEKYFSLLAENGNNSAVGLLWGLISAEITKMK